MRAGSLDLDFEALEGIEDDSRNAVPVIGYSLSVSHVTAVTTSTITQASYLRPDVAKRISCHGFRSPSVAHGLAALHEGHK